MLLLIVACGGDRGVLPGRDPPAGGNKSPAPAGSPSPPVPAGGCPPSVGFTGPVNDHGAATATSSQLKLEADDFFFSPTCVTRVSAGAVTLLVHNPGFSLHSITIPAQNIDEDVARGQTVTVQVNVGFAPVPFFCKYHRTSGMLGALLPGEG